MHYLALGLRRRTGSYATAFRLCAANYTLRVLFDVLIGRTVISPVEQLKESISPQEQLYFVACVCLHACIVEDFYPENVFNTETS